MFKLNYTENLLKEMYKNALLEGLKEKNKNYTKKAEIKPKTGRNENCPCGSGKKFKKCCLGGKNSAL